MQPLAGATAAGAAAGPQQWAALAGAQTQALAMLAGALGGARSRARGWLVVGAYMSGSSASCRSCLPGLLRLPACAACLEGSQLTRSPCAPASHLPPWHTCREGGAAGRLVLPQILQPAGGYGGEVVPPRGCMRRRWRVRRVLLVAHRCLPPAILPPSPRPHITPPLRRLCKTRRRPPGARRGGQRTTSCCRTQRARTATPRTRPWRRRRTAATAASVQILVSAPAGLARQPGCLMCCAVLRGAVLGSGRRAQSRGGSPSRRVPFASSWRRVPLFPPPPTYRPRRHRLRLCRPCGRNGLR